MGETEHLDVHDFWICGTCRNSYLETVSGNTIWDFLEFCYLKIVKVGDLPISGIWTSRFSIFYMLELRTYEVVGFRNFEISKL